MANIPQALRENEIDFDEKRDQPTVEGYTRRILTGVRPSGALHLGHYVGAQKNWLKLQEKFDSTFLIADWHAIADHAEQIATVRSSILEVMTDFLAIGLDPKKAHFMLQTSVPELENITTLISNFVALARHKRNPTLKQEMSQMRESAKTLAFFNYPVSQAADILGPRGDLVPAGADQRPQIELTREIARTINSLYGETHGFYLPVPQILVGEIGRLPGIDGKNKMSKTLGNAIYLKDSSKSIKEKVKQMSSAPKAIDEPGVVEGHVVFEYLDAFHCSTQELIDLKERYTRGGVGEGTVKQVLIDELNTFLEPIREKRATLEQNPAQVMEILTESTKEVRMRVRETANRLREMLGIMLLD